MNDNKLAVVKLAIETITPATEKLGLRFCEVMEKGDANWADIIKTETSARYQVIASGNEVNVTKMLENEGKAVDAAFSFLDKLLGKGFSLVEKALDLKAMEEAGRVPEREARNASIEMETRLAERKLAIAEMEAQARMMEAKARLAREELALLLEEQRQKEEQHAEQREERAVTNGHIKVAQPAVPRQSDNW